MNRREGFKRHEKTYEDGDSSVFQLVLYPKENPRKLHFKVKQNAEVRKFKGKVKASHITVNTEYVSNISNTNVFTCFLHH